MSQVECTALQNAGRPKEPIQTTHITATSLRDDGGEAYTVYRANGDVFRSLASLKAALAGGQ